MSSTTLDTTTVRRWKRYQGIRSAASEWIDVYPDGWTGLPLKRWVGIKITDGPHETPPLVDEGIEFVSAEAVNDGRINFDSRRGFICKSGATTGKLAIVETDIEFSVWSPLAQIRANSRSLFPRYLFWALQSEYVQNQIRRTWSAGTQPNISMGSLERLFVVAPTAIPEQRAIAAFLDREMARIDSLIGHKERLIALLEEKRQAVISHAVTRGLDSAVPLRDSGVPWLGMVPKHWTISKLKHACNLIKDGTHLPPPRTASGYPLLSVRNIVEGQFVTLSDDSTISEEDFVALRRVLEVKKDDVLLAIVGATIGKVAVVGDLPPFAIQRSLAALRPKVSLLRHRFLSYFLQSSAFQRLLWEQVSYSAQPGIYLNDLENFNVLLPEASEQIEIIDFIDKQTETLNKALARIGDGIAHLQEYRTGLISAAVTGQIDVRGEV